MIQYLSDTNGGKYDRAINGYDFDTQFYETETSSDVCYTNNNFFGVWKLANYSGYCWCTGKNLGILEFCPSGTKASYAVGGCVNETSDTSVFPAGSHCASQPCQNGGVCYDFSSADAYFCHCFYPHTGLHCQIQEQSCGARLCGNRTSEMLPMGIWLHIR